MPARVHHWCEVQLLDNKNLGAREQRTPSGHLTSFKKKSGQLTWYPAANSLFRPRRMHLDRRHKSLALICSRYYALCMHILPLDRLLRPQEHSAFLSPMHPSDGKHFRARSRSQWFGGWDRGADRVVGPIEPRTLWLSLSQSTHESTLDFSTLPRP
jgi:hypothetical protein